MAIRFPCPCCNVTFVKSCHAGFINAAPIHSSYSLDNSVGYALALIGRLSQELWVKLFLSSFDLTVIVTIVTPGDSNFLQELRFD